MYALMLWCHWTPDTDSLALGTRTGVKDIFAGIPTLPSLSISENAYRVLFTNASVNTCNNNLLTKP